MPNRKLIRPNLAEIKEKMSSRRSGPGRESSGSTPAPRRRPVPPEQTAAEAFYYLKQMNNRTPMVVVLDDGEQVRGHIEWYDRNCIKVHREDEPNMLIFKHCIKYVYKQEEEEQATGPEPVPALD
jgi:sRNA-binding regulator protein Hfq